MPFNAKAHVWYLEHEPGKLAAGPATPWLSTLDWYLAHGEDPDPQDRAVWTFTGVLLAEQGGGTVTKTYTGKLPGLDLKALRAEHPQVRVWHVTGRARAPYADTALPEPALDRMYSLLEILRAAAGTELDDDQRSGVADTISALLAGGEPFDGDNDVAGQVLETIARIAESR